jgi:hypothetical protein
VVGLEVWMLFPVQGECKKVQGVAKPRSPTNKKFSASSGYQCRFFLQPVDVQILSHFSPAQTHCTLFGYKKFKNL